MMEKSLAALLLANLVLAGCMDAIVPSPLGKLPPVPTASLVADAETVPVGTVGQDAADDPAIWRNPVNPAASLIVGTDKKAGLYVYDLDGKVRSFLAEGALNNVDIREITVRGVQTILVAASVRNDPRNAMIGLYSLDPESAELTALGQYPAGPGEAYGFCLGQDRGGEIFAYLITKGGMVREHVLKFDPEKTMVTASREFQLGGQAEGCVVDDRTGRLYVGEEESAIWLFDLNEDDFQPLRFANVDGRELVGDVEGLAIAPDGASSGYLVASSQGDNAYVLYDLLTGKFVYRFRLTDGAIDGTSETDGIEVITGSFGTDYPGGLMVVQDGSNERRTQNFKLISWQKVLTSMAD